MTTYDLEIYQGATYSLGLTLRDDDSVPIDLTPYTMSGYLKKRYSDTTKLADLNATVVTPASGTITLSIASTGTAILPIAYLVYDVEIRHTGTAVVSKALMGKASVYPEATY